MWTCPKCGREFQRMNQGHYCGKAPTTVEEYISLQQPIYFPYTRDMPLKLMERIVKWCLK